MPLDGADGVPDNEHRLAGVQPRASEVVADSLTLTLAWRDGGPRVKHSRLDGSHRLVQGRQSGEQQIAKEHKKSEDGPAVDQRHAGATNAGLACNLEGAGIEQILDGLPQQCVHFNHTDGQRRAFQPYARPSRDTKRDTVGAPNTLR